MGILAEMQADSTATLYGLADFGVTVTFSNPTTTFTTGRGVETFVSATVVAGNFSPVPATYNRLVDGEQLVSDLRGVLPYNAGVTVGQRMTLSSTVFEVQVVDRHEGYREIFLKRVKGGG